MLMLEYTFYLLFKSTVVAWRESVFTGAVNWYSQCV